MLRELFRNVDLFDGLVIISLFFNKTLAKRKKKETFDTLFYNQENK